MALAGETPSSVLYADLRSCGISNKDAARVLLSDTVLIGGKTPRSRVDSRTYLSREVVHVTPDRVYPGMFADFYVSTQTLCGRIMARKSDLQVVEHYAGVAARNMEAALAAYGISAQMYKNEVVRLRSAHLQREQDRPLLLFMLFCITGCLADVGRAIELVEQFAQRKLTLDLATITTASSSITTMMSADAPSLLGLLRIVNGMAQPPIYPLSPEGSTIGAHAVGPGAITNVGSDVSRLHARVWRDGTRWMCQGLLSTNGTFIVLAADRSQVMVEPPRSQRMPNVTYEPQEIHEGDMLCMGRTQFLVLRIQAPGMPITT